MPVKRGLGKGLSALLPSEEDEKSDPSSRTKPVSEAESREAGNLKTGPAVPGGSVPGGEIFIALEKLKANPQQPRKTFDEEELAELADSIKQQGIIQPLIAEEDESGNYIIIAGERRARAAQLAGLKKVPVVLRKYPDEKRLVVSLIENIQRANLNPIEEAAAYKQLMEMERLSQDEAAAKVGKKRTTVANSLRLLKLPPAIQESLSKRKISPGHAIAILSITGVKAQDTLFREIIKKNLSVREAEKRAKVLGGHDGESGKKNRKALSKARPPEIEAMTEKFITRLGTKVVINGNLSKGTIIIDYYSMEDLDRLYEILGG